MTHLHLVKVVDDATRKSDIETKRMVLRMAEHQRDAAQRTVERLTREIEDLEREG